MCDFYFKPVWFVPNSVPKNQGKLYSVKNCYMSIEPNEMPYALQYCAYKFSKWKREFEIRILHSDRKASWGFCWTSCLPPFVFIICILAEMPRWKDWTSTREINKERSSKQETSENKFLKEITKQSRKRRKDCVAMRAYLNSSVNNEQSFSS